ncbi:hypothetical protein FRC11_003172, partial [Ceratobasidium sp. 423]
NIIKHLVYKKLDTTLCLTEQEGDQVTWVIQKALKFLPEFKIYKSDWPIRAFIQVILKSANYVHKKLSHKLLLNPDHPDLPAPNMTAANNAEQFIIEEAKRIVDGDSSEDEATAGDADTTMASAANETFGVANMTMVLVSNGRHGGNILDKASDSDKDNRNFLKRILSPELLAPLSAHTHTTTSSAPAKAPSTQAVVHSSTTAQPGPAPTPVPTMSHPVTESLPPPATRPKLKPKLHMRPPPEHSTPEPAPESAPHQMLTTTSVPTRAHTTEWEAEPKPESQPELEPVKQCKKPKSKSKSKSKPKPEPEPEPEP